MKSILDQIIELNHNNSNYVEDKQYNIFSVLKIQTKEVLICRMIADLLNPRGQHGIGSKYLELFLNNVIGVTVKDTQLNNAIITTEYLISGDRRIDIVIEIGKKFIPIEVKIYAGEQLSQCFDYLEFARKKDVDAVVYYLTLYGNSPSSYSISNSQYTLDEKDVKTISFREDILNWLRACKEISDLQMSFILEQFIANIETITGYTNMRVIDMVSDEIYSSEDKLRASIQIADSINEAKAKLLKTIFEEFELQMNEFAKRNNWTREQAINWYEYKNQATTEFYNNKYGSTYPGINYIVNEAKMNEGYQLWFRIEVEHNLFAGFCVFNPNGKSPEGKGNQIDKYNLATRKAVNNYLNVSEDEQENWWATWWYLPNGEKYIDDIVPNFKTMNDAAIALADKIKREEFVKNCIDIIDKKIKKTVKKRM